MSLPTLLAECELLAGGRLKVEGDEYRHLFRARRLAVGDDLRVVDGVGGAREARIESVAKNQATIVIGAEAESRESPFDLLLLVAAPRLERAANLVEKATELGVTSVRFIASERAPRSYGERNLDRLRRMATAGLEQCGRARLPLVDGVHAWSSLAYLVEGRESRWVLSQGGEVWTDSFRGSSGVVVVGPEGGFTHLEIQELETLDCRRIDLGPRILRVETAAMAAATLCLRSR